MKEINGDYSNKKAVKFAKAVGFNTILYYYREQLIEELKKYNIEVNL